MATVDVDASRLRPGDTAGLALLNQPYAWIGLVRGADGMAVRVYEQTTGTSTEQRLESARVKLRVHCDFDTEKARFSYSVDGQTFRTLGQEFTTVFQLTTFQGIRYSLFHYNSGDGPGGYVDFDGFEVQEPRPRGLTKPIPVGSQIVLTASHSDVALAARNGTLQSASGAGGATPFRVLDAGSGRVALQAPDGRFVSVTWAGSAGHVPLRPGPPGKAETFQWVDLGRGDVLLLSLYTNRYVRVPLIPGPAAADHPGPAPDRRDGSCFRWRLAE